MRLFGYNITRGASVPEKASAVVLPPESEYAVATSQRSWEYAFKGLLNDYVPLTVDFDKYRAIREGLPFVDAALRKMARLVSGFSVTSDNEQLADDLNAWLGQVRFGDVLHGFDTFEYAYVNDLLQFGRACAEITLTQSGRDVWGLYMVDADKLKLVQTTDGLQLGEQDAFGSLKPYPVQELFAYSALNVEGDNPHGTSILRSLQFVANISLVMENALRQKWMRNGAPAFLLVDKMPADLVGVDQAASTRAAAIKANWNAAQRARWNSEGIIDFVMSTQGEFSVDPIESGQELEFVNSMRTLQEQIVSTLELAPFMLGIQWSTTERLSQQQADMIISTVNAIRREIEPAYLRIVAWYMKTHGWRGEIEPDWADVSLQDMVETSKADQQEASAFKTRTETALLAWANGWVDQMGAADLAGLDVEDVAVEREVPVLPGASATNLDAAQETAARMWEAY